MYNHLHPCHHSKCYSGNLNISSKHCVSIFVRTLLFVLVFRKPSDVQQFINNMHNSQIVQTVRVIAQLFVKKQENALVWLLASVGLQIPDPKSAAKNNRIYGRLSKLRPHEIGKTFLDGISLNTAQKNFSRRTGHFNAFKLPNFYIDDENFCLTSKQRPACTLWADSSILRAQRNSYLITSW